MIKIKEFIFLKAINLYVKIIDVSLYVEKCKVLEQQENLTILNYLEKWLQKIQNDIEGFIFRHYHDKDVIGDSENDNNLSRLQDEYGAFYRTIENLRYVPVQPPFFTLKNMVDEAIKVPLAYKISNIHFKSIFQYNFTEAVMLEPKIDDSDSTVTVGPLPNILSIGITYFNNPLVWPLILHEYGHAVYDHRVGQKEKNAISKKMDEFCKSNKIDIISSEWEKKCVDECVTEIYSDLFGIRYYGTSYFFAFYFHEILSAEIDRLINVNEKFHSDTHPPSIIRMNYMIEELKKLKIYDNDECFKNLLKLHQPFGEEIEKRIEEIPDNYQKLYNFMYSEISKTLKKFSLEHDQTLIDDLVKRLKHGEPIGTVPKKNLDIKKALRANKEIDLEDPIKNFDIEDPTRIIDIVTTGWNYFILNLIQESYKNYSDYPISKFKNDYKFFINNLNYSMETSGIVSSYQRKL